MRLDKLLWCVRCFKTRSLAAEACRRGHVRLRGEPPNPPATVQVGDTFAVRRPPIWREYRVEQLPTSRVGAALVPELITETTSFAELEKAEIARKLASETSALPGRPSKKNRRDIDRFRDL